MWYNKLIANFYEVELAKMVAFVHLMTENDQMSFVLVCLFGQSLKPELSGETLNQMFD